MKIEKASRKDRPAIKSLVRQYPNELLQDHLPPSKSFYVARSERGVVGCCALAIYSKRMAEVRSLAVLKGQEGNGIASALVAACMKEAKEKQIYEVITITKGNKRTFFGKHGLTDSSVDQKVPLFKVLGK